MKLGLFIDYDMCVGCHTCEISCKQEHMTPDGVNYVKVVQAGPTLVDGWMQMYFLHMVKDGCNLCQHRIQQGKLPACVVNCPTDALQLSVDDEIIRTLSNDKKKNLCRIIET